jgi:hypothetical protein
MPGVLLPFNETVGNTIPPDTPHVSDASPFVITYFFEQH